MINNQVLEVELVERVYFDIELSETDLIDVTLNVVDVIYKNDVISFDSFVCNEEPTQLTSTTFQTAHAYRSGSLQVFLNGIKEKNITEITDQQFSIPIAYVTGDTIEVNYLRK